MVRLLLDNCLSPLLKAPLQQAGHDVLHVGDVGMSAADDTKILSFATQNDRVIVTQDRDFAALLVGTGQVSPSIIYLRLTNRQPANHARLLVASLPSLAADLCQGAIAVITDAGVRVRLLPIP